MAFASTGIRSKAALAAGGAVLIATAGVVLWPDPAGGNSPDSLVQNGEIGFVLTDIAYVTGPHADEAGTCPAGMSKNLVEIFNATPEGARRPGESDQAFSERSEAGGRALGDAPDGRNYCQHPQIAPPEPNFRTMRDSRVRIDGLDLDGKHTAGSDFLTPGGSRGVDNQFYRATGCSQSFQPGGQSNQFSIPMYAGEWGILVRLTEVDDLENDPSVEVGLYANSDPMQLSPTREALRFATYAIDQDPRFRALTRGKIANGVLTTDPVDVRFRTVVNSMHLERVLRDARLRAEVSADGSLTGIMAGFAPVEALYDQQFGYRNGKDGGGQPAAEQLRTGSSNGAARVLGYTCTGIYQALHRLADGHPDPQTGRNSSISVQYRFSAVNAFLVDVDTSSANEALAASSAPPDRGS